MSAPATLVPWKIDPAHSLVEFPVKHMMIATLKGRFTGFQATIVADPADLSTATLEADIDTASVDTREPQRDAHLRSPDFFDAENHPTISLRTRSIERKAHDQYKLHGDLTIRGVTRPVTLDLTVDGQGKDPWGNERLAFSIEGTLNRKDWGLNWNTLLETGGVLVSDQIRIYVQVSAIAVRGES